MSNLFICLLPFLVCTFVSILAFIILIAYFHYSYFSCDIEFVLSPLLLLFVWIGLALDPIHYCSSCDLYGTVDYCTDCGSYIGADECPDCGFSFSDFSDFSFCPDCGKEVSK